MGEDIIGNSCVKEMQRARRSSWRQQRKLKVREKHVRRVLSCRRCGTRGFLGWYGGGGGQWPPSLPTERLQEGALATKATERQIDLLHLSSFTFQPISILLSPSKCAAVGSSRPALAPPRSLQGASRERKGQP
ncbi:hypothetical protein SRHO_G00149710 [Serrasalmus rhombeus]